MQLKILKVSFFLKKIKLKKIKLIPAPPHLIF